MKAPAALLAAAAFVAAAKELPNSLRETQVRVRGGAEVSRLERELAPARSFGLNPALVLRAEDVLPRDALFSVLVGGGPSSARDAQLPFTVYWLLPRRYTPDPPHADWILDYGGDASQLAVRYDVVEDGVGEPGWRILRVRE